MTGDGTRELQELLAPELAELLADYGQPLELRRADETGRNTLDGRVVTTGGTLWAGVGILLPMTDQQRQQAAQGSTTSVPALQVFLPPDAPAGQPGFQIVDPATGQRYQTARDAINWKGIYWDLLVYAPGEVVA
ncbi:hypothetical protein GCM10017784_11230 [Deinococcus indicus]|uniref:hypothetical protein n=1 Tax=Deinococcus indicus TaxID=223556 RepID=UPI00174D3EFB|nr:hypothetical protein [Deinococcus indicus]GHG21488.1 hypothetical protein GCM10017784_11230 [Deinococcus indicus]